VNCFGGNLGTMKPPLVYDDGEWPYVLTLLPVDLQDSAKQANALVRCRNVPDAAALIRMALAYGVSDLSLKDVAAWASTLEVAEITGPGLFYRLREAEAWLQRVLAQTLQTEVREAPPGIPLRVVDASVIVGPGAAGTEWRAHVVINPATGCFQTVELTDDPGGEGYGRHPIAEGEMILGDRAYATARGIHAVRTRNAHVVARLNPHALRVCDTNRRRISILDRQNEVPKVGVIELNIIIPVPPQKRSKSHKSWSLSKAVAWIPARVVAARTRNGDVIWILTTTFSAEASALRIMELYRLRWQIELLFKRLKSLLHLDNLPSRQGPTAKSWMLARLLAAALGQKLVQPSGPFSPWGYDLRKRELHA
jgi:hypothetical protein